MKRQTVIADKKQDPTLCCLQETYFKYKNTDRLKVKVQRKTYHTNTNKKKKAEVALLISDRADSEQEKLLGINRGNT